MAEEAYKPKPGDVVRLKSGGPEMTITRPKVHEGTDQWECCWFLTIQPQELKTACFTADALELVPPKEPRKPREPEPKSRFI
jgi:uncharacterized protein YodC (DUF2158 family)